MHGDIKPDPFDDAEEAWPQPLTRARAAEILGENALVPVALSPLRVIALQALVGVCGALLWWFAVDRAAALSALLGAAIVALPAGLFAWRLHWVARSGRLSAIQILAGQIIKLMMTLLLFGWIVIKWPGVRWLPLMLMVVLTVNVPWLALIRLGRRGP